MFFSHWAPGSLSATTRNSGRFTHRQAHSSFDLVPRASDAISLSHRYPSLQLPSQIFGNLDYYSSAGQRPDRLSLPFLYRKVVTPKVPPLSNRLQARSPNVSPPLIHHSTRSSTKSSFYSCFLRLPSCLPPPPSSPSSATEAPKPNEEAMEPWPL
jgi:hypothetical protein